MIGLILAAGNNTRIAEHIDYPSKVLIPLGGRSLLVRNIDAISPFVDSFIIVVGKALSEIKENITLAGYSKHVVFVNQEVATGTLDAVRTALTMIDDDVFLILGDEFLINDRIPLMIDVFLKSDVGISVGIIPDSDEALIKNAYTMSYESEYVSKFIEKPNTPLNKDRGTGYYILKKEVLNLLPQIDTEKKDIVDLFNFGIENGYKAISFRIAEEEYNINTVEQLDRAIMAFSLLEV